MHQDSAKKSKRIYSLQFDYRIDYTSPAGGQDPNLMRAERNEINSDQAY